MSAECERSVNDTIDIDGALLGFDASDAGLREMLAGIAGNSDCWPVFLL